ncbi:hypothetical protein [Providencia sp. PROV039]|uniref:hypothetical protein n=1 Tax=Providencia sp. PROV039 TaxID=2949770 RepID=UPI00234A4DD8|nr:hypothetical protein [Providencia sp. PROV039]
MSINNKVTNVLIEHFSSIIQPDEEINEIIKLIKSGKSERELRNDIQIILMKFSIKCAKVNTHDEKVQKELLEKIKSVTSDKQ